MTLANVEKRLVELEKKVEKLAASQTTGNWWIEHAGRFADDPVFEEIVRLGRQYRQSTRPKRGKKRAHS